MALVLGVIAVASLVEYLARGRRAVRWRSSLLIVICGALGAVVAVAVDMLTSSISTEYFVGVLQW